MAARTVSRRLSRDLVAVGSFVAWAICTQAQEKPREPTKPEEKLQEVVITGSRIARPDLDRLEPTTVVKGELFDERGYTDVGQALQELPAFGIQPSSAVNQQAGFGIAQSFVDLYSLGSQRTLTLINGRRFVSSSTASLFNGATSPGQQVDLNVVPTKLIDRVETISVGGAPIYGADAIAGTVNIILKKNFQGLDFDAQTGVSNAKDGWNYRFRALGGLNFAEGRGNITGVAELNKSDGLIGTRRANVANDLGFNAPLTPGPFKTVLTPNGSVPSVSTSGIPLVDDVFFAPAFGLTPQLFGVNNASGQPLAWSPASSALKPYNLGTQTGNPIFWEGGDGIRLSQFTNLLSPQKRVNLDTLGNFKFTDHFAAFAEGWFSEEHATNLISQPAYNTNLFGPAGTVFGNFVMSVNNPFLSAADRSTIQNALNAYGANVPAGSRADPNWNNSHFYVSRASTDLQSGVAVVDQVVSRGVLGINGDFALGERSYTWEIAGNYGYSRDTNHTPLYVFQNVQNALNATRDASGNIVCAGNPVNSPIATGSSTCAPLNIFGLGSASAAARQYITHDALARSIDTQRDVTANLTGDVVKLPAGSLKAAIGYENRRETAQFQPDSFYTTSAGQTVASPVSGGYRTNEFYAETLIPIFEPLQAIPALHQLELEGAVRRVNNSIAGTSTTWTKGLRWSPIQDLQFRGNKTRSIRAPAVTELFLPASTAFEFANDPCDKNYVTQGTAPATRAKNCAAAGINTSTFVSNVVNATAQGLTSGNQSLTSETANSRTYGVVVRPRFIPRLNLSVDFIEINLSNAIEQLNLVEILDACYDSANYPNDPSCSQFTRNGAHQIASFNDGFVNAGLLGFQGITYGADWSVRMPGQWGGLELRANWLDTRKLLQKIGSASANSLVGELGTNFAAPHGKGVIDVNYRNGGFEWYWQGLYTGPFNFDNKDKANTKDVLGVSHWWLVNTTIGYAFTKSFETRLIINNVANKEPPFPALAGIGGNFASPTSLYWSGIIGRTYLLSVAYHF
jgi:iron complex outermembrane recepter protein